jgi:hypothetical protein
MSEGFERPPYRPSDSFRAMRTVLVAVLASVLAALAGCSNEGAAGSCYRIPDNACVEYGASMGGAGKRMCSSFVWKEGAQSCPQDNRLGTCIKEKGAVSEIMYGGSPNNYTLGVAKNACEFKGGVFTPSTTPASGH